SKPTRRTAMSYSKIYVFDGVATPAPIKITRGDTGDHNFALWHTDSRGEKVEPFDLTDYTFAMQVRPFAGSDEVKIDVPETAFSVSQDQEAADWEEEKEDVQNRQNLLNVKIPKSLTEINAGDWFYDIEFYPPNTDPEEKYTYAGGPYIVIQDITISE
ncbi:MAG: hypothetical protein ACOCUK_02365, partial [bacterium]